MADHDDRSLIDAVAVGARRATGHFLRAGVEVLWGISAFVDEIRYHDGPTATAQTIPVEDEEAPSTATRPEDPVADGDDGATAER
jgi:hypothetical protein